MDLSAHISDATITAAIRTEIAKRYGGILEDAALLDSSLVAKLLDVRLNDLPGLLPRINVAATGEKPRWRYKLSDIRNFIEARKIQPTKQQGKIRI
jgi:hypothetical protein